MILEPSSAYQLMESVEDIGLLFKEVISNPQKEWFEVHALVGEWEMQSLIIKPTGLTATEEITILHGEEIGDDTPVSILLHTGKTGIHLFGPLLLVD